MSLFPYFNDRPFSTEILFAPLSQPESDWIIQGRNFLAQPFEAEKWVTWISGHPAFSHVEKKDALRALFARGQMSLELEQVFRFRANYFLLFLALQEMVRTQNSERDFILLDGDLISLEDSLRDEILIIEEIMCSLSVPRKDIMACVQLLYYDFGRAVLNGFDLSKANEMILEMTKRFELPTNMILLLNRLYLHYIAGSDKANQFMRLNLESETPLWIAKTVDFSHLSDYTYKAQRYALAILSNETAEGAPYTSKGIKLGDVKTQFLDRVKSFQSIWDKVPMLTLLGLRALCRDASQSSLLLELVKRLRPEARTQTNLEQFIPELRKADNPLKRALLMEILDLTPTAGLHEQQLFFMIQLFEDLAASVWEVDVDINQQADDKDWFYHVVKQIPEKSRTEVLERIYRAWISTPASDNDAPEHVNFAMWNAFLAIYSRMRVEEREQESCLIDIFKDLKRGWFKFNAKAVRGLSVKFLPSQNVPAKHLKELNIWMRLGFNADIFSFITHLQTISGAVGISYWIEKLLHHWPEDEKLRFLLICTIQNLHFDFADADMLLEFLTLKADKTFVSHDDLIDTLKPTEITHHLIAELTRCSINGIKAIQLNPQLKLTEPLTKSLIRFGYHFSPAQNLKLFKQLSQLDCHEWQRVVEALEYNPGKKDKLFPLLLALKIKLLAMTSSAHRLQIDKLLQGLKITEKFLDFIDYIPPCPVLELFPGLVNLFQLLEFDDNEPCLEALAGFNSRGMWRICKNTADLANFLSNCNRVGKKKWHGTEHWPYKLALLITYYAHRDDGLRDGPDPKLAKAGLKDGRDGLRHDSDPELTKIGPNVVRYDDLDSIWAEKIQDSTDLSLIRSLIIGLPYQREVNAVGFRDLITRWEKSPEKDFRSLIKGIGSFEEPISFNSLNERQRFLTLCNSSLNCDDVTYENYRLIPGVIREDVLGAISTPGLSYGVEALTSYKFDELISRLGSCKRHDPAEAVFTFSWILFSREMNGGVVFGSGETEDNDFKGLSNLIKETKIVVSNYSVDVLAALQPMIPYLRHPKSTPSELTQLLDLMATSSELRVCGREFNPYDKEAQKFLIDLIIRSKKPLQADEADIRSFVSNLSHYQDPFDLLQFAHFIGILPLQLFLKYKIDLKIYFESFFNDSAGGICGLLPFLSAVTLDSVLKDPIAAWEFVNDLLQRCEQEEAAIFLCMHYHAQIEVKTEDGLKIRPLTIADCSSLKDRCLQGVLLKQEQVVNICHSISCTRFENCKIEDLMRHLFSLVMPLKSTKREKHKQPIYVSPSLALLQSSADTENHPPLDFVLLDDAFGGEVGDKKRKSEENSASFTDISLARFNELIEACTRRWKGLTEIQQAALDLYLEDNYFGKSNMLLEQLEEVGCQIRQKPILFNSWNLILAYIGNHVDEVPADQVLTLREEKLFTVLKSILFSDSLEQGVLGYYEAIKGEIVAQLNLKKPKIE